MEGWLTGGGARQCMAGRKTPLSALADIATRPQARDGGHNGPTSVAGVVVVEGCCAVSLSLLC